MTGLNLKRLSMSKILSRFSKPNSHSQRQWSRKSRRSARRALVGVQPGRDDQTQI